MVHHFLSAPAKLRAYRRKMASDRILMRMMARRIDGFDQRLLEMHRRYEDLHEYVHLDQQPSIDALKDNVGALRHKVYNNHDAEITELQGWFDCLQEDCAEAIEFTKLIRQRTDARYDRLAENAAALESLPY